VKDVDDSDQPSKKKRPLWFPLHVGDFIADTAHLTCEQLGAYMRLLCAMWRTDDCTLPDDETRLRKCSRAHPPNWRRVWGEVKSMFEPYPSEGAQEITRRDLFVEFGIAQRNLRMAEEKGRKGGEAKAAALTLTPGSGSNQTAPNTLKNNNGGLAAALPNTTQHNTESQRREEKETEKGSPSQKNGIQEKREEMRQWLTQSLPPAYWDALTDEIFDCAIDAEIEREGSGMVLIAEHHEKHKASKEKG
jgi:uncharacterized protein YdaU (DUF1376 family)